MGRSVTASVVAGFAACLLGVAALIAWATDATFEQEQRRAEAALASTAASQADDLATLFDSAVPLLLDLAADPGLGSLDPGACAQALSPLDSVTGQARLVAVDATGRTVCSLPPMGAVDTVEPGLFAAALDGEVQLTTDAFVEPWTDHPAVAVAAPLHGAEGPVGAVLGILFTDVPELQLSPGVDDATVVVAVDPVTGLVIATTERAPFAPGDRVTWTEPPARDADGVRRIWRVVEEPDTGWKVAAGLDVDVALAAARDQRQALLLIGVAILGLVVVLAFALQRRLARPIRRLGSAIAASRSGAEAVRAPEAGPSEIVEVARAFNELVDAHQGLIGRLRWNARHDHLTGLLNRRGAMEELTRLLGDPAAAPLVVLFIDLDRFKLVNDSHGHSVGDELLVELTARLRASVPDTWIVTRFGGDEFVIICPATVDPVPAVEALGEVLRAPIAVDRHDLRVGGSTGIARARPGITVDDLLREADTAMYRAKERGRGGWAEFDAEMRAWTLDRLTTETDLRGAADRGELVLHYQPVVDLPTGETSGVEALVRWQHPTLGLLAPASFIPVAEDSDLILEVGRWVMGEAARQAASWRADGRPLRVSVNVAAAQLVRTDLVAMVASALSVAGAEATDLTVEVTETAVLSDVEATITQLDGLRRLGVRVALDDFGTGFSSLAYLQRLPADELKIDRSFVATMATDPVSEAIVASVVNLAHAVGLVVVAEGIETVEQLDALRQLGCDEVQGFLLGRPVSPADLAPARAAASLTAAAR
jgi:diguanylate cyclase (GGDEF)-like protein